MNDRNAEEATKRKAEVKAAKDRVDNYLSTIDRLEPNITMVDRDAALTSIAISLVRIADLMEEFVIRGRL